MRANLSGFSPRNNDATHESKFSEGDSFRLPKALPHGSQPLRAGDQAN
jgi:hypothetical protein